MLFTRNSHLNLSGVFNVCLELPSDSKNKFGFVVNEFSELQHNPYNL